MINNAGQFFYVRQSPCQTSGGSLRTSLCECGFVCEAARGTDASAAVGCRALGAAPPNEAGSTVSHFLAIG
jgi:hypothetical protein